MSRILDLAKEFKATSSKEAESINNELRSDLAKLKSDIHSELSSGRQSLQSDIQAHNRALTEALANSTQELKKKVYKNQAKMSWSLFVTWFWVVLALMTLCLGLIGWSVFQSKTIATQSRQITEAKATLAILEDKTLGVALKKCTLKEGKPEWKPCAQLDKKFIKSSWGEEKTPLMVLETK